MIGTVKWFNPERGFGFIIPLDARGDDVFVSDRQLRRAGIAQLREGDRVTYDIETAHNGRVHAANIRLSAS